MKVISAPRRGSRSLVRRIAAALACPATSTAPAIIYGISGVRCLIHIVLFLVRARRSRAGLGGLYTDPRGINKCRHGNRGTRNTVCSFKDKNGELRRQGAAARLRVAVVPVEQGPSTTCGTPLAGRPRPTATTAPTSERCGNCRSPVGFNPTAGGLPA